MRQKDDDATEGHQCRRRTMWEKDDVGEGRCGRRTMWEKDDVGEGRCGRRTMWKKDDVGEGRCVREDSGYAYRHGTIWKWDFPPTEGLYVLA